MPLCLTSCTKSLLQRGRPQLRAECTEEINRPLRESNASTGPPSIEGGMMPCLFGRPERPDASTGPPSIEGGMRLYGYKRNDYSPASTGPPSIEGGMSHSSNPSYQSKSRLQRGRPQLRAEWLELVTQAEAETELQRGRPQLRAEWLLVRYS